MNKFCLTLSLPRCHLKTANESDKFEILKVFLFAFSHWHERISAKRHTIEDRVIIGPENVLFCRLVREPFNPEILQTVAVKGLNQSVERLDRSSPQSMYVGTDQFFVRIYQRR